MKKKSKPDTKRTLHRECMNRLKQAQHEAINMMVAVIEALDPYTRDHSLNVANYSLLLAEELKLPADQIVLMHYAGLFHDVGKIGISPEILKKQGPLTQEEYILIQQHPAKGANIMAQYSPFLELVPIILHHHEWVNGKGYPDGLKGEQIPLGSRLVAIADAYDAMTTNRPYRKAQDLKKTLEVLKKNAGKQFDADMVKAFLKIAKNL